MQVTPQIRMDYPDSDLQVRVSRFLRSRHFSNFRRLKVTVTHGQVKVSGEVDSFYEKQIAINACQHVAGVLGLIDEIAVCPTAPRKAK